MSPIGRHHDNTVKPRARRYNRDDRREVRTVLRTGDVELLDDALLDTQPRGRAIWASI